MTIGTEKIEAILSVVEKLVIAGKKIKADGKVDLQDLPVVISLLPQIPSMIDALKDVSAAVEEGKDLDVSEIVSLIQSIAAKVKEIEKA